MGALTDALDNLGISDVSLSEGAEGSQGGVHDVMVKWANDVIKDLQDSLDREQSTGTSKALRQSMRVIPSRTATQLLVEIAMLDYYDYTNKGVEGFGGKKANGSPWVKKKTFGTYRFKKPFIKVDNSLRQWANAKNLSEYALRSSIARQGIEGTLWYDNVVIDEIFTDLAKRIAKHLGE